MSGSMVSVRGATISLVLFSIVVVAFCCTYFSITSGERALQDTQDTRDKSLDACFGVGEGNVMKRTNDFVDQVLEGSVIGVKALLKPMQLIAEQYVAQMMVHTDANEAESWEALWSKRSDLQILISTQRVAGVTGAGYITRKKQLLEFYERPETHTNPDDGFHPVYLSHNNGTDYDSHGPAAGRTISAHTHDYTGDPVGDMWPTEECAEARDVPMKEDDPMLDPCVAPNHGPHTTFWPLNFIIQPGPENVKWVQLLPAGPYVGLMLIGTYSTPNTPTFGLFYFGMELSLMSKYLQGIKLGSNNARVFTNVAENWMGHITKDPQRHVLTGVSRGLATHVSSAGQSMITPDESLDPIISGTGAYIRDLEGSYEGLVNETTAHEFRMNGTNGAEEAYFLRVRRLQDLAKGINWYCTIVLDREYILGEIDREVVAVRVQVADSSSSVDSRLVEERSVLIGSLAGVAVVLLVVCVVLVVRITAPLMVLRDEMALVATMRLEGVDAKRSLSRLDEVRCMQESFLLVVRNLHEYRNYMPASVLETTSDEGSEKDGSGSVFSQSFTETHSSHSDSRAGSNAANFVAFSSDVKTKKVSLVVVGLRSLHGETNISTLQGTHRGYLSNVLQVCKELKGVPDGFQGDEVYMSWNAVRAASNQASTVGRCCHLLERRVEGALTVGAVTGTARCGNMGCEGMKKFTFMGGLFGLLRLLERLNDEYGTRNLVNEAVAEHTKLQYTMKTVGRVVYKRHAKEPLTVHTVMEAKDVATAEWMYELQEGERASPYAAYNLSVRAFFESNYTSALSALERQTVSDEHIRKYKEVISQRILDKKPFAPLASLSSDCV